MSKSQTEIYSYGPLALLICLCSLGAWSLCFLQDDAFISFRYAKNLVDGYGLVYNPGEWVEGYSNFLWTLILSAVMWCGIEPGFAAQFIGILFFVAHLFLIARLGRELKLSEVSILCAVAAVGLNYSFAAYATGGLETSLHSFLISSLALMCLRTLRANAGGEREGNLVAIGALTSLALLARMDSAIFVLSLAGPIVLKLATQTKFLRKMSILASLPIMTLVVWSAWRHWMYGGWLPNTFYVKLASNTSFARGGAFLGLFFLRIFFICHS